MRLRELEKKSKEEEKTKQEQKMKRLREDELKKKGKKGAKKDAKEVSKRRSVIEGKEVCSRPNARKCYANQSICKLPLAHTV